MNEVSFKANYIGKVSVQKSYYKKYKPFDVSLVKMNPSNESDIRAVLKTTSLWDDSLTAFTYDDMKKNISTDIFALTTQKNNLKKPLASKILGLIQLSDNPKGGKRIDVLQTNPKYIHNKVLNDSPKYKHIGQTLVEFATTKFSDENFYAHPTKSAVPFYKKQGFRWLKKLNNLMFHKKAES